MSIQQKLWLTNPSEVFSGHSASMTLTRATESFVDYEEIGYVEINPDGVHAEDGFLIVSDESIADAMTRYVGSLNKRLEVAQKEVERIKALQEQAA